MVAPVNHVSVVLATLSTQSVTYVLLSLQAPTVPLLQVSIESCRAVSTPLLDTTVTSVSGRLQEPYAMSAKATSLGKPVTPVELDTHSLSAPVAPNVSQV